MSIKLTKRYALAQKLRKINGLHYSRDLLDTIEDHYKGEITGGLLSLFLYRVINFVYGVIGLVIWFFIKDQNWSEYFFIFMTISFVIINSIYMIINYIRYRKSRLKK